MIPYDKASIAIIVVVVIALVALIGLVFNISDEELIAGLSEMLARPIGEQPTSSVLAMVFVIWLLFGRSK